MNKRFALTVGINDYPGTNSDLSGCVNDARDWAVMLRQCGYEVTTLLDAEATKTNILEALRTLVARAGWADRIVFQYSGHGTWLPDGSGDEADGRDEALVCYDFANGGLLVDDDLQAVFGQMSNGTGGLILSDSCHSGTVSRFVAPEGTPRFLPPSMFVEGFSEERLEQLARIPASTPRATASLISGCADHEYSYDAWFNGRPNGAFTRAAIDSFKPSMSLSQWFHTIRQLLPNTAGYPYSQTPQLTSASLYRRYARAL